MDLIVMLLLGVVSATIVGVHVAAYQVVSPIDEESHIDYALRAPGWQPVVSGDRWLPETMLEEQCRGKEGGRRPDPTCRSDPPLQAQTFGLDGYTSGYVHPPTYYDITAVLGRAIRRLFGYSSPVTGFRLVGALWLWAGLALTYLASRRLGAARVAAVAATVLIAGTPAVFYSDAIVNPDAASVLVGAFVTWSVLRWDASTSRRAWLLLAAAGLVSTGVKLQNGLVDLVLAGQLLTLAAWPVGAWLRAGRGGAIPWDRLGRRVSGVAVLGVPAVAVAAAWTIASRANATLAPARNPMSVAFTVPRLPPGALTENLALFLTPLRRAWIPASYASPWLTAGVDAATLVFLAALVATATFRRYGPAQHALAWWLAVVGVFGGVLFTVVNWVALHQYIHGLSQRYSLTLVPVFAALVAVSARSRKAKAVLAVLAGGTYLAALGVLLAAPH